MSNKELPGWLFPDDVEPEPTLEEARALWESIAGDVCRGMQANFGNRGGDMWELLGTVESIRLEGDSVFVDLCDCTLAPEGGAPQWLKEQGAETMAGKTLEFSICEPPKIYSGSQIVLPGPVDYWMGIDIGFLERLSPSRD